MHRFNVVTVRGAATPFIARAFEDVERLLLLSLRSLGFECERSADGIDPARCNIVLGYHLLAGPDDVRGARCIVYQLEQLPGQTAPWLALDARKLEILRGAHAVWDLSPRNIAVLAAAGLAGVQHVPIGSHPGLRIADADAPEPAPDIDVLFYGAINARRKAILDRLRRHCRVRAFYGVYGPRRDALIRRARIVLNVHSAAEPSVAEQPRIAYLLNNRRFVLTEQSDDDPYGDAVAAVPYDRLVEACLHYLADPAARADWAARGHAFLAARPMTASLGVALAASGLSSASTRTVSR